jgi:ATP-dependent RNA helicase RhlE
MALVFTRTKHRANRLAKFLDEAGITCDRIHGNRSQPQRESALAAFRSGKLQVLVATDIASRGIDVRELPHVINFDVPLQPDDYIHRVGRTARAERTGRAVTLVSPEEEGALQAIERAVGRRLDRQRVAGFDYTAPEPAPLSRQHPAAPRSRGPKRPVMAAAPTPVRKAGATSAGGRSFGQVRRRTRAAA